MQNENKNVRILIQAKFQKFMDILDFSIKTTSTYPTLVTRSRSLSIVHLAACNANACINNKTIDYNAPCMYKCTISYKCKFS